MWLCQTATRIFLYTCTNMLLCLVHISYALFVLYVFKVRHDQACPCISYNFYTISSFSLFNFSWHKKTSVCNFFGWKPNTEFPKNNKREGKNQTKACHYRSYVTYTDVSKLQCTCKSRVPRDISQQWSCTAFLHFAACLESAYPLRNDILKEKNCVN